MKIKRTSCLLVVLQLSAIFAILFSAPMFCHNLHLLAIEILGILLALFAIWNMGIGNFNIAPIPKQKGALRITGIYKTVRHPMYLATLIALCPLIIDFYSLIRLLIYIALLIVLIIKLNFEEGLLEKHFEGYKLYKTKSWRLIPFVY